MTIKCSLWKRFLAAFTDLLIVILLFGLLIVALYVGGNGVDEFTIIVFEDDVIKLLYWSLILKVNV